MRNECNGCAVESSDRTCDRSEMAVEGECYVAGERSAPDESQSAMSAGDSLVLFW